MTEAVEKLAAEEEEEETAEEMETWAKEQWLLKFSEIWRAPEDMKTRLNQLFQRYFSCDTALFPVAYSDPAHSSSSSSSSSSSASTTERVQRLVFLCTEQQRVQPFVLEVIRFFESLLDDALS